jgi:hypothetical protein
MDATELERQILTRASLSKTRDVCADQGAGRASLQSLFTRAGERGRLLALLVLLWPNVLPGAPILVRFVEGTLHGFLALRTVDGTLIASGDLVQISRGGTVESHMAFHFKDGSIFDERVMFTQQRVFKLEKYHLIYSGPIFTSDADISLEANLREVPCQNQKA